MPFTLANSSENIVTLTNTSDTDNFVYTIHRLGNNGEFEPVDDLEEEPEAILEPEASVNIDLEDDGIYALISSNPDNTYYFFLNHNLRECEKAFDKTLLCQSCDTCESLMFLKNIMRFKVLRDRFYFIANKYIQDQSVVDLLTPELGELLYWEDILNQLSNLCGCNIDTESESTSANCGCS